MDRLPIIAGNWKMNKTVGEAVAFIRKLKDLVSGVNDVEIVVAPPFTAISALRSEIEGSSIKLSAQNLHWEEKGAYTGEISPVMLKDLDCKYVIIGHSERRQYFGETDEIINRKLKAAIKNGINPIFCIGETLLEREKGETFNVINRQLELGLKDIKKGEIKEIVIAYEPVWAIGTGRTATPSQAEEAHRFIRERLEVLFSREISEAVRIQYGGSVTPENIKALMEQANIDGALVGGASLLAESFSRIVRFKEI